MLNKKMEIYLKMVLITILLCLLFSCRAQAKIEMKPQILLSSAYDEIAKEMYPIIVINNISDSRPYENYDIFINILYKARLLNRPRIARNNGFEVPLSIFYDETGNQFNEKSKIRIISFTAKNYVEYYEEYIVEEFEYYDMFGTITAKTIDFPNSATVIVDMLIGYDSNDQNASTELISRRYELRDFVRRYFSKKRAVELSLEKEDEVKTEILYILNTSFFDTEIVKVILFNRLDVIEF